MYQTEDNTSKLDGRIKYYKKFSSAMYIDKAGYFDERPLVNTSVTQLIVLFLLPILTVKLSLWFLLLIPFIFFGYGKLYIYLPIKTGIQDCDSAAWGFHYHGNMIWIYIGGAGNFEGGRKWKTVTMPWNYEFYRHSILLANDEWKHRYHNDKIRFYEEEWKSKQKMWSYDYTDSYDGKVIPTKIYVEEREWRQGWLFFTSLFNKVHRVIDIHFSDEVGKEKGSWKGGTIGCSWDLLSNEDPIDCIKRMEKERKF